MERTSKASVLTIAGSDSSGGAGIQADIKTIEAHGLFATSVITAITAQNTTGVRSVQDVEPRIVRDQIDAVFEDIRPHAVKIGMVSSAEIVAVIAEALRHHHAKHIVVDPVMVATSGSALIKTDAVQALEEELFPMAQVITPNIPEAEALSDVPIAQVDQMIEAAWGIAARIRAVSSPKEVPAILVKGGHSLGDAKQADDLLFQPDGTVTWLKGERIDNPNTHGTGCTLSSAIACGLAEGRDVESACRAAKAYLTEALAFGLDLGQGSGPLEHMWRFSGEVMQDS